MLPAVAFATCSRARTRLLVLHISGVFLCGLFWLACAHFIVIFLSEAISARGSRLDTMSSFRDDEDPGHFFRVPIPRQCNVAYQTMDVGCVFCHEVSRVQMCARMRVTDTGITMDGAPQPKAPPPPPPLRRPPGTELGHWSEWEQWQEAERAATRSSPWPKAPPKAPPQDRGRAGPKKEGAGSASGGQRKKPGRDWGRGSAARETQHQQEQKQAASSSSAAPAATEDGAAAAAAAAAAAPSSFEVPKAKWGDHGKGPAGASGQARAPTRKAKVEAVKVLCSAAPATGRSDAGQPSSAVGASDAAAADTQPNAPPPASLVAGSAPADAGGGPDTGALFGAPSATETDSGRRRSRLSTPSPPRKANEDMEDGGAADGGEKKRGRWENSANSSGAP